MKIFGWFSKNKNIPIGEILVQVTKKDLEDVLRTTDPIRDCAVAKALNRVVKVHDLGVGYENGHFGTQKGRVDFPIPPQVSDKMRDLYNGRTVKPFSFTLPANIFGENQCSKS